jgi:stearoyl-CoA desaturase (delta-9 desaturase)
VLYFALCGLVFLGAYLVNITYISVFYHRALTHHAVQLTPWARKWVIHSGIWFTGLDPKAWCCMHRAHHLYSDTERDPHSPSNRGVFGVVIDQYQAYKKNLRGLIGSRREYTSLVKDLDFPVNWLNRNRMGNLPYYVHGLVGVSLGLFFGTWLLGLCYFLGMMSHPIQGWMVNSLGHRLGYRNFNLPDNSRNNTTVAWLVMGEGYQNNHHKYPSSPTFAVKWWELDLGFGLCRVAQFFRFIRIPKEAT